MGFSTFLEEIVSFVQNHTAIVIVLALGVLFFVYRKPKLFFVVFFIALFLAGLLYMITNLAGSGSEQKKRFIHQEEEQSDNTR